MLCRIVGTCRQSALFPLDNITPSIDFGTLLEVFMFNLLCVLFAENEMRPSDKNVDNI